MDYVRSGKALAKVIEYSGEAIEQLSVDERATMTNMAAEIGGFTGIVAPDQKAVEFLVERRGLDRKLAEQMIEGLISDPDAQYAHVIELDACGAGQQQGQNDLGGFLRGRWIAHLGVATRPGERTN